MTAAEPTTRGLVVAANRLPVVRGTDESGGPRWVPSPGGLVSAVEPVLRSYDATWVGWAGDSGPAPDPFELERLHVVPVGLSAPDVEEYYEGFCNATVWPLFHDRPVPPVFHRRWWRRYREVNERFAAVTARAAIPGGAVWVHDYHLMLVPRLVRAAHPDVRLAWFGHVPFPPVELLAQLPWRGEVLEGLLGADLLGFQSPGDADNFLRGCARLRGLPVTGGTVTVPGRDGAVARRTVRVGVFPISVDFPGLDAMARTREVVASAADLRRSLGEPATVLLGVDRLDYTKGIPHRLRAYGELLDEGALPHPGTVLAEAGLPTRERIGAYRSLRAEVEGIAARIDGRHPGAVRLLHRYCTPAERLAMYRAADVMLVTPLRDGMNLVAKEYVAARADLGGALVLSELSGAWHELKDGVFSCNPHDVEGTKRAVLQALRCPEPERRRRMALLRGQVSGHDAHRWAEELLTALGARISRSRPSARSAAGPAPPRRPEP